MCKAASAVPERSGGMEAKAGTWNVAPRASGDRPGNSLLFRTALFLLIIFWGVDITEER